MQKLFTEKMAKEAFVHQTNHTTSSFNTGKPIRATEKLPKVNISVIVKKQKFK